MSKSDNGRRLAQEVTKTWIEVQLIAGQFSDQSKLSFEFDAKFTDSQTIQIELKFKEKLQISLYSDSDKILIKLWGAFIAVDDHSFLSTANRFYEKHVPP